MNIKDIAKPIIYIFALIGFCTVAYLLVFQDKNSINNKHIKDEKIILKQLLLLANNPILVNNCEGFQGSQQTLVYDFLSSYLNMAIFGKGTTSISCNERKVGECSFSYGRKSEHNKGWRDILFFEYNSTTKNINPKSFECLSL